MEYKYSKKEVSAFLNNVSKKNDGYLTTKTYDEMREKHYPASKWISNMFGSFDLALEKSGVLNKKEYEKKKYEIQIIKNLKLLSLQNEGYVSQSLYTENKFTPSVKYIVKYYGWDEMIKKANVINLYNQTTEQLIEELKQSVKNLGHVPTSSEYEKLKIKPSLKIMSNRGLTFSQAMKTAGFKTYGKSVKDKDKICSDFDCYNQFTPNPQQQNYCESCYLKKRIKISKDIENFSSYKLKEIAKKLIFNGNNDKTIKEIMGIIENN